MSGLDVLSALDPDDMPFLIFVTASDSYAATALDLAAVDYLFKPCTPKRFALAVGKIRQCVGLRPGGRGWQATAGGTETHPHCCSESTENPGEILPNPS